MFGISRGAYTARSVAGVIDNRGVLRLDDVETDRVCREAYRMYRSKDHLHRLHSPQMAAFREHKVWSLVGDGVAWTSPLLPLVRRMGLSDTVGSLRIPTYAGGVSLEWPKFHSNEVSPVAQGVCHLVSLHDRCYIFQPCPARRKKQGRQGINEE